MPTPSWDERYESENLPWDTHSPAAQLVELFARPTFVPPRRVLEIGCGTGTNALWLAEQGCEVLGLDISPRAIAKAQAKAQAKPTRGPLRFVAADFLTVDLDHEAPFEFVFDRGVLHVFDDAADQAHFAARVADRLAPGGRWLSILGSTEGPPRQEGPPRRSVRDLALAIEPALELVELHAVTFDERTPVPAWLVVARKRDVAAQPSTRRG